MERCGVSPPRSTGLYGETGTVTRPLAKGAPGAAIGGEASLIADLFCYAAAVRADPPSKNSTMRPDRGWWLAAAVVPTLALLLAHGLYYRFLTDDAFISFRYARHLAMGQGLVFNPGGERVEGYSNFLWVLILAALNRVGVAPETSSQLLGFG